MRTFVSFIASVVLIVSMACDTTTERAADHVADKPYLLDTPVETVSFSAENPTGARGAGGQEASRLGVRRFMGAVIGVRPLAPNWWGEGEVKFYLDGDTEFPSLCGTGSEDYICLAFGVQQTPFLYHGASLAGDEFVTAYRWHLPDPIYWNKDIRVTMQQIGYEPGTGLVERSDDWCAVPFWYEPIPSEPLPPLPGLEERVADLAPFEAKW